MDLKKVHHYISQKLNILTFGWRCRLDVLPRGPITAVINVTKRCNSSCEYCSIWQHRNTTEPTLDEMQRILMELQQQGVQQVSFSGGEPLLRNDLEQLISIGKKFKMIVNLSTNGLILTKNRIASLSAAGLDFVVVSMDTLTPELYQQIRGVPLSPVIEVLCNLSRREVFKSEMIPTVNCVITARNLEGIPSMVERLSEMGIFTGFQPFHAYLSTPQEVVRNYGFTKADNLLLRTLMDRLIQMKLSHYLISSSVNYLKGIPDFLLSGKGPKRCFTGFLSTSIDENLNVKPCWLMPPIGNLRQNSFIDIWNSSSYRNARKKMIHLHCLHCWLRCHTEQPLLWRMHIGEFIKPTTQFSQRYYPAAFSPMR